MGVIGLAIQNLGKRSDYIIPQNLLMEAFEAADGREALRPGIQACTVGRSASSILPALNAEDYAEPNFCATQPKGLRHRRLDGAGVSLCASAS